MMNRNKTIQNLHFGYRTLKEKFFVLLFYCIVNKTTRKSVVASTNCELLHCNAVETHDLETIRIKN